LEAQTVRFLDNFSAGTRGSASAEYFLSNDNYAVIFLYRKYSFEPFSRKFMSRKRDFLEYLQEDGGGLSVIPNAQSQPLFEAFKKYKEVIYKIQGELNLNCYLKMANYGKSRQKKKERC
jgi:phosphopantothenate-cysteine ligase